MTFESVSFLIFNVPLQVNACRLLLLFRFNTNKMRFTVLLAASWFAFAACQNQESDETVSTAEQEVPQLLCTTSIMADWVSNLAPAHMEVRSLLQKGVDPHVYKPGKADLDALRQADVILYHGVHLEGKIIDVLEKMQGTTVIDAASQVPDSLIVADANFPASKDPHYWFDPLVVRYTLEHISAQLSAQYPAYQEEIETNLENYLREIDATADSVQKILYVLPEDRRIVVTTHDALSYFARAFGLTVKTLQGASTVSSFGLREITELVNFICENGVPTIFLENIVSPQSMESVQRGCEKKGCSVTLGPELLSDSLGNETDQDTYLEMLLFNATTLVKYLQ